MSALYNLPTDNVAGNATWAAIASADTAYPASNISLLTDLDRGNPAKLTIKTAGGWYGSFASSPGVQIVVLWHNGDAGQTVKIESHTSTLSNPVTAATMSTTLTLPAVREDGYFVKVFKDITGVSGYSATHLHWRIYFPVSGANNTQNWGLKVWMGSTIRTLDRSLQSPTRKPDQHQRLHLPTDYGYSWRYDLQGAPRQLSGTIGTKKGTSWENLLSWYRASSGSVKPMLFVPDISENDAWIAQFGATGSGVGTDQLDATMTIPNYNPIIFSIEEVTAGGPEWT
jgi:hypothetical protein